MPDLVHLLLLPLLPLVLPEQLQTHGTHAGDSQDHQGDGQDGILWFLVRLRSHRRNVGCRDLGPHVVGQMRSVLVTNMTSMPLDLIEKLRFRIGRVFRRRISLESVVP